MTNTNFNTIPVMHCFDNNYVIPAGVAFYSLLKNSSKDYFYNLYVLHTDITKENQEILTETIKLFPNAKLEFINMNNKFEDLFKKTTFKGHYSKEIYYKFLAPSIFTQYDKIIIADVDVVYLNDISSIYNGLNIEEDFYLYGCQTIAKKNGPIEKFREIYNDKFDTEEIKRFITNAGFWVYNLRKMRQDGLEEKFINFAKENVKKIVLPEQDTVNYICYPKIKLMPANAMVTNMGCRDYNDKKYDEDINYSEDEVKLALNNPIQLHYSTNQKPWKTICEKQEIWFKYLVETPVLKVYLKSIDKKLNPKIKRLINIRIPFTNRNIFIAKEKVCK